LNLPGNVFFFLFILADAYLSPCPYLPEDVLVLATDVSNLLLGVGTRQYSLVFFLTSFNSYSSSKLTQSTPSSSSFSVKATFTKNTSPSSVVSISNYIASGVSHPSLLHSMAIFTITSSSTSSLAFLFAFTLMFFTL
jgi:hypothetical protein